MTSSSHLASCANIIVFHIITPSHNIIMSSNLLYLIDLQPSTTSSTFNLQQHHPPSTFFNLLQPSTTSSTFNLLRPSSTFNNIIHLQPSTSSTFNLLRPSTFIPSMPLQAFDLPHLSGFRTHTHNLVRWLDVTRFRKMRTLLGGLRVPHPTEPGKHGLAVHNPSSSGVGGQTLFAAGLPVLLALLNLHCMSSALEDRRSLQRACRRFALLLG